MKYLGLISLSAVLLFTGAGCAPVAQEESSLTFNYPDSVQDDSIQDEIIQDETGQGETIKEEVQDEPVQKEEVQEEPANKSWKFPGTLPSEQISNKQVRISTAKGDIVFELYADTAPMTVSNFVYLTEGGYYNGLTFHRREEGFVIQGGDPSGNGTGGPGYDFADELKDDYSYERGIVAMANRGPSTNGSQFFVMLGDVPLPKSYSIFGRVLEGIDVVDEIVVGDVMTTVMVEELSK